MKYIGFLIIVYSLLTIFTYDLYPRLIFLSTQLLELMFGVTLVTIYYCNEYIIKRGSNKK